jgi:CRP/FNR family cyclic AMP-dependent transcriptional regulator
MQETKAVSAVIEHLRRVPLFQGMTDDALEAVAGLASETAFKDGAIVVHEGADGDAFYIVVDGTLRVTRAGGLLRELGPGDFLGEISLVDGRPRTATATAVGPVKALVIQRQAFMDLIDRYAAVRLGILMALTERLRGDPEDVLD